MKTSSAFELNPQQISVLKLLVSDQIPSADIHIYDDSFLVRSFNRRARDNECLTAGAYVEFMQQHPGEAGLFLDSLFISYSEFFRNALTFSVLERIVIPSLLFQAGGARKKEIRIWSAACAAGQESYSLAMLMEEAKYGHKGKFSYRIFATDQSEALVQKAGIGEYAPEALGNLSLKRVGRWFVNEGSTYTVAEELKKNMDFSVFDLFSDQYSSPPASIFGDFDLVVCANLLFYYKQEYREMILQKAGSSLAGGGYVVSGETERDILLKYDYREAFPQSAIFSKNK